MKPGRMWRVFGVHPNGDVDIADKDNLSLFEKLPAALAEKICLEHNKAIDELEDCYIDLLDLFSEKEGGAALLPEEEKQGDRTTPPSRL